MFEEHQTCFFQNKVSSERRNLASEGGLEKTKQINNYYTIRQNASWEIPYEKNEEKSDLKEFLNYMTSEFVKGDIPIPIYSNRINHEFTRLTTNSINPTQFDMPLTGAVAIRFFTC